VNNVLSSDVGQAFTGCPQGSVLGATLFLFFIDHLKSIFVGRAHFCIYADDLKTYVAVEKLGGCQQLQTVLDDLGGWCHDVGLNLTPEKCGVMHFGSKNPRFDYLLCGGSLRKLEVVKDIGVRYSPSLNFSEQVRHIAAKASLISNWILRSFALKSPSAYLKLYESLVLPVMFYACQVWHPSRRSDIELLQKCRISFDAGWSSDAILPDTPLYSLQLRLSCGVLI